MISDEKRREVASKLRGLDEHIDGVPSMLSPQLHNAMALCAIRAVVGKGDIFHLLADLIDRRADGGKAAVTVELSDEALPPRPCLVDGERCLFHGAYVKQWTHGASPLIGGFPAGQESRLVAVVEGEDGTLREVLASRVCLLDSETSFGEYRWDNARVSGRKSSDDERTNRDSQQTSQAM